MKPGDWIRQRHQKDAPERLVCAFAPINGVLVTWNEQEGYRWALRLSCEVIREGSPVDRMRAEDLCRPKNLGCRQHLEWIFGTQVHP